jgi:hypothetical protein
MESGDGVAVHRFTLQHHLEPVELGGIVGAGDLDSPFDPEMMDREIQSGGGQLPDVLGDGAGGGDAFAQGPGERLTRGPVVAPDRQPGYPAQLLPRRRGEGLSQGPRDLGRQIDADDSPDVVLAEDGARHRHARTGNQGAPARTPASDAWNSDVALATEASRAGVGQTPRTTITTHATATVPAATAGSGNSLVSAVAGRM